MTDTLIFFFIVWDFDIFVILCVGWCHTLAVSVLTDLCECEEAAVQHGSPEHMVMCNDQDILHYKWANCQSTAAHWEQNADVSPPTSRKKLNWLNIFHQNSLLCFSVLQSLFSRLTFNVSFGKRTVWLDRFQCVCLYRWLASRLSKLKAAVGASAPPPPKVYPTLQNIHF